MAYAAAGVAALKASRGDVEGAERRLREVASVGLLMVDEGTGPAPHLAGTILADLSLSHLEALFRVTGEEGRAQAILAGRDSRDIMLGERGARLRSTADPLGRVDPGVARRTMLAMAVDTSVARGQRWEALALGLNTLRCTNVPEFVFGLKEDAVTAREEARASLVRYPSEEALFELTETTMDAFDPDLIGLPSPPFFDFPLVRIPISFSERVLGFPDWTDCFVIGDIMTRVE